MLGKLKERFTRRLDGLRKALMARQLTSPQFRSQIDIFRVPARPDEQPPISYRGRLGEADIFRWNPDEPIEELDRDEWQERRLEDGEVVAQRVLAGRIKRKVFEAVRSQHLENAQPLFPEHRGGTRPADEPSRETDTTDDSRSAANR